MSEYIARGGTTALGIIGTVLGSIGTVGSGALGLGKVVNGGAVMDSERCKDMLRELSEKDSEVARLKGEKYTDEHILETYQYVDSRLRAVEKQISDNAAAQAVINCKLDCGINLLNQQVNSINNTLALITKTAVPKSIVVDFSAATTTA
nr:MAG TPA: hypothetical protein [Caudoviricetes sp.]